MTDGLNRSMKMWNLLTYLIVNRNRAIPQAEFMEILWPDEMDGNPVSALKTLFFRIRRMLASVFGEELSLIVSRSGTYAWNKEIPCVVDAEEFEKRCHRGGNTGLKDEERMRLYQRAADLYQGDFFPKLQGQLWVISHRTHYHEIYLSMVKEYSFLLQKAGEYSRIAQMCLKATQIEYFDEQLHILYLRALLCQGKHAAALGHYEKATDFLYRNLGARPSPELQSLYRDIMDELKSPETDLLQIQKSLGEEARAEGAFYCELGFFKYAYRLFARMAHRTGISVHLLLFSLFNRDGAEIELEALSDAAEQLKTDIQINLRRADILTRYSASQLLLLVPQASYEDCIMIGERISSAFGKHYRLRNLRLVCRIQPLEAFGGMPSLTEGDEEGQADAGG